MDQRTQVPEISPLHVTHSISIFNEVHDFQRVLNMMIGNMIAGTLKLMQLPPYMEQKVFNPHYSPTETSQVLFWVEIKSFMFSVFCKNLQTSVGHMLVKCHSDSSDTQKIAKNYAITTKALFMPKDMCKTFEQSSPTYALPHRKENSRHSSINGNPNG